ncbi:unnamed protein product [Brassica oleracea var. botrytis]
MAWRETEPVLATNKLTNSSLLIRFNDSKSLDELTELNDKMCDDEIQGEDASEPCLALKRRK